MTSVFPCSSLTKSKTPQGIEPRPNKVRSATTGVFCFFVVAVRAKAKPGGTIQVCSSRKRKPLHTRLLHYPVTTRGFLGHEAETRRWDIWFPHSPAFPTALNWHNDFHHLFIHIKRHDTSIPGDTQSLFSFAIRQDSRIKGIAKAFSCLFCSCNGKRQTI